MSGLARARAPDRAAPRNRFSIIGGEAPQVHAIRAGSRGESRNKRYPQISESESTGQVYSLWNQAKQDCPTPNRTARERVFAGQDGRGLSFQQVAQFAGVEAIGLADQVFLPLTFVDVAADEVTRLLFLHKGAQHLASRVPPGRNFVESSAVGWAMANEHQVGQPPEGLQLLGDALLGVLARG